MRLPSRRQAFLLLSAALLFTAVVPLALFYGLDFRVEYDGSGYLRSGAGDASALWAWLAFVVGPLTVGILAYPTLVLAPGPLGRTRWRFVIGIPVAALSALALFLAAIAGYLVYGSCGDG